MKKHVVIDNLRYMYKNWWNWSRTSVLFCALRVFALIVVPVVTALVPKLIIDCIEQQVAPTKMMLVVIGISAAIAALGWIDPFSYNKINASAENTRMQYRLMAFRKALNTDYVNMESHEGRQKFEKSKDFSFGGRWSGSQDFYEQTVQFSASILGVFSYLAILYVLKPSILLIVLVTCFVEVLLSRLLRKGEKQFYWESASVRSQTQYFYKTAISPQEGKDIRIFSMQKWIENLLDGIAQQYTKLLSKLTRQTICVTSGRAVISLVRELLVYMILIGLVLKDSITISDFVFYFGIATGFSAWILGIANQMVNIENVCQHCQEYRDFIELSEKDSGVTRIDARQAVNQIEFKDVMFQYDSADQPTIHGVSFVVQQGERIAIVGENGAGKTTLIKMLCGLYRPTNGSVLIDGVDCATITKDDYYNLFAPIFQDYNFLPMSIEANVTLQQHENIDQTRLDSAIEAAGLREKINTLSDGLQSKMVRQVFKEAVDFSGGERQRLLLARALYKDAPVLILDEPTAALDPIAESRLYEKYSELSDGKISFFISHRLASTRFCDRILYMQDGKITEAGTHDELMYLKGNYWRMYQTQSYYYSHAEGEEVTI